MNHYRITGSYGGLEVQRVVHALDEDDARTSTGITDVLEAAGWSVLDIDGDEWTIDLIEPPFCQYCYEPVERNLEGMWKHRDRITGSCDLRIMDSIGDDE